MAAALGQVAYEAYCEKTGWRSRFSGDALPEWKDQDPEIRECWEAAANAVAEDVEARLR